MQIIYALLCILGTVLPLAQFVPWLADHGLAISLLVQQAIATTISAFAWSDVLVCGVAVVLFVLTERCRLAMRRPWVLLLAPGVGPSLALPHFLLLREQHLAAGPNKSLRTDANAPMN